MSHGPWLAAPTTEEAPEDASEDPAEDASEESPEDASEESPEDASEEVSEEVSEGALVVAAPAELSALQRFLGKFRKS